MSPSILPPITGEFPVDFSRRQVLPASAAVSTAPLPRFRQRDHERSRIVREVMDSFESSPLLPIPRPIVDDAMSESIVMSGSEIQRTWRKTGAHAVRQVTVAPLTVEEPLSIVGEVVGTPADESLQAAASEALATMANRRPHARRGHRLPAKRLQTPRTASPIWLAVVIVLGALTAAVLLSGVLVNR